MKGVMNASPEVLRALAQEGIRLTEEELLLAAQSRPQGLGSANGAVASLPRVHWYVAVLCRLGIHEGPWGYLAEGHCAQMRECGRCGFVKVRSKHQREWRYVGDRTCGQTRTCKRCDAVSGTRTRHAWSEPYAVEPSWWGGENRTHRCQRCGAVETWTCSED